ncbi:hypothetical protein TELCIR_16705 [Teladorsagia circumcincta]|uniref:Uncharacterized protein n=1 Tax=Teladorsagia circumcincta TaxID=45464 RepID=A0A2G9TUS0_TELCI|nr:hypothetical protein TELCIR_16705 [Teladorsagia circumcincta]
MLAVQIGSNDSQTYKELHKYFGRKRKEALCTVQSLFSKTTSGSMTLMICLVPINHPKWMKGLGSLDDVRSSVVMNREETERYINVVVSTNFWKGESGAEIKFMYPALYRTSCMLDIR